MAGINANTVLMLHCDGVDGSTTFTDDSPSAHTVTLNGTPEIDTDFYVFGGASAYFSTAEAMIISDSSDWDFGSGEFTVDFRLRFIGTFSNPQIIGQGITNTYLSWRILVTADGSLQFQYTTNGSSITTIDSNYNLSTATWYHIAVVRDGNTLRIFVDGDEKDGGDLTGVTIYNSSYAFNVGKMYSPGQGSSTSSGFTGWIDEIRIQKGEAYWTSNFTPPTEAYSASPGDESVTVNEDLTLSDEILPYENPQSVTIEEDLTIADEVIPVAGNLEIEINENISLDDNIFAFENPQTISIDEDLYLSDDEDISTIEPIYSAARIITGGSLIIVTDTDPAKIHHIDISTPSSPIKTVYTLTGTKNAKDIVLNDISDYFYVICAEGKVVKVAKSNLNDQTIINTGETDTFKNIICFEVPLEAQNHLIQAFHVVFLLHLLL